ncbi:Voltage-dependent anion-selective channel [Schistosoma japonicum]|uniref:Voltage-dependent anion-selective channel n=1 Tax=Schistosoma japonicum TaxID=6182 RepID=A0A4Z2DFR5_SCHJA|nr:Voltage-dependent anion-selective channel [Schistosoma japonicum]
MVPPSFSDLGKDARDLLFKKFYFGVYNIHCETKKNNIEYKSNLSDGPRPNKMYFDLQEKLAFPQYGFAITKKWSSNNVIDGEIVFEDKLVDGLKQTFQISRDPFKKCFNANLINSFRNDHVNSNVEMFFKSAIPDLSPSLVFGYQGYLVGADVKLDCTNQILQKANFAVGYTVQDFAFHGLITNWGKQFSANMFQRITDRLHIGGSITWKRVPDEIIWAVGSQYILDNQNKHSIKCRLDHLNQISLAFTTYLSKGLQFTLSGVFNGPDIAKMGIGLELNA